MGNSNSKHSRRGKPKTTKTTKTPVLRSIVIPSGLLLIPLNHVYDAGGPHKSLSKSSHGKSERARNSGKPETNTFNAVPTAFGDSGAAYYEFPRPVFSQKEDSNHSMIVVRKVLNAMQHALNVIMEISSAKYRILDEYYSDECTSEMNAKGVIRGCPGEVRGASCGDSTETVAEVDQDALERQKAAEQMNEIRLKKPCLAIRERLASTPTPTTKFTRKLARQATRGIVGMPRTDTPVGPPENCS